MHSELVRAKNIMLDGGYTCVVCGSDYTLTSVDRGVKPLLSWIDENRSFEDAYISDKVIGKAAAMLYVLLGAKSVYATVISNPAKQVFLEYGIECYYDTLVDAIRNRTNTGFCPMETAVRDISDLTEALNAIKSTLQKLNSK